MDRIFKSRIKLDLKSRIKSETTKLSSLITLLKRFSDVQHTRTPELLTAKQVDDYLTIPIANLPCAGVRDPIREGILPEFLCLLLFFRQVDLA